MSMFYFVSRAGDVLGSCGCILSGEDANQEEKKLSLRRYKKWWETARNFVVQFLLYDGCGAPACLRRDAAGVLFTSELMVMT